MYTIILLYFLFVVVKEIEMRRHYRRGEKYIRQLLTTPPTNMEIQMKNRRKRRQK